MCINYTRYREYLTEQSAMFQWFTEVDDTTVWDTLFWETRKALENSYQGMDTAKPAWLLEDLLYDVILNGLIAEYQRLHPDEDVPRNYIHEYLFHDRGVETDDTAIGRVHRILNEIVVEMARASKDVDWKISIAELIERVEKEAARQQEMVESEEDEESEEVLA